jgi:c-di-AMP phosphodiesterase-like protein
MNTNKKLPRLFQPGMKLYFSILFIFAVSAFFIGDYQWVLGGIMIFVLILLAVIWRFGTKKRTQRFLNYLESMSDGLSSTIRDTPLPAVMFNSETGEILWSNNRFISMTDIKGLYFELRISDVVPDFSGEWLLDGKNECPECIRLGDKKFRVYGSIIPSEDGDLIATTYWVDVTELEQISEKYHDSRAVFAIISLDNYEELTKGLSEREKSTILTDVDEQINVWIRGSDGFLCRYTRDKYLLLLDEKSLIPLVEGNFYVLDSVRTIIGTNGIHATLSVGIGKDGKSPLENSRFAALSIEMALSRGGDQAVVRNKFGFEFFGGHTITHDNPTKVRSRIMANAFGELVLDASAVFVMGHKFADFDSVAAACGCCCIARAKGKNAYIVIDAERSNALELITMFDDISE